MPVYNNGNFFGTHYIRQIINGLPMDQIQCCPFDGNTNLAYPAYLNNSNTKGLSQPFGPIGDNGMIVPSGIAAPNSTGYDPSGYIRPVPSGLQRGPFAWPAFGGGGMNYQEPNMAGVAAPALPQGTTGTGFDGHTDYLEANWYQPYWLCQNGHFFLYPSASGMPLPDGYLNGNNDPLMTQITDAGSQIEQP
jgi:hypothetical protein